MLASYEDDVVAVAWSPHDRALAAVPAGQNTVAVVNTKTGAEVLRLPNHNGTVTAVVFSPSDPNVLVTGSDDGLVRLWRLSDGALSSQLPSFTYPGIPLDPVVALALSKADPDLLVVGHASDGVVAWRLSTGEMVHQLFHSMSGLGSALVYLDSVEDNAEVVSIALSPHNPDVLAAGYRDGLVVVWDLASGKRLHSLTGHFDWVRSLAFSPDDPDLLASASDDRTVRDLEPGLGFLRSGAF